MKGKTLKIRKNRQGFTLPELMISIAISTIIFLGVAIALVDSQKAWGKMYGNINSDVAVESLSACKKFDAVVRQSSGQNFTIDPAGSWVEVYYYSSSSATNADRYAKFYLQNKQLVLDSGILSPKQTLSLQTLCHSVTGCKFRAVGHSVQMFLTLNDNTRSMTVASSNVMNNN